MPILPKKVLFSRRNTLFSKPGSQEPCIFLSKLFWLFKSYYLLGQINLNRVWLWLQQRLCLWSCDGCRPAQHIPAQSPFSVAVSSFRSMDLTIGKEAHCAACYPSSELPYFAAENIIFTICSASKWNEAGKYLQLFMWSNPSYFIFSPMLKPAKLWGCVLLLIQPQDVAGGIEAVG